MPLLQNLQATCIKRVRLLNSDIYQNFLTMAAKDDYVEAVVGKLDDLAGPFPLMREVDVAEHGKCLLIRHEDGEITALGHKCTHYGAPLARGAISKGVVRCPWHGACFNAKTGDIEDYPGIDSLPKYQVSVDKSSGDIKVRANIEQLKNSKRNSALDSRIDPCGKNESIIIIGGGPASLVCAETLRKEGYVGVIVMICEESHLPYDRAKLSKAPDSDPQAIRLRPDLEYYQNIKVEVLLKTKVVSVNFETNEVKTETAGSDSQTKSLRYDRLFVATGGSPRTLHPTPGWDCGNIHVLRTVDDANKMTEACKGKKVVLIGSSFIAMEIAAFLAKKKECESITVVCGRRSKVPFQSSLGPQIGSLIMKMHEDKGVRFHVGVGVSELLLDESSEIVKQLKLTDDTIIDVDTVVLGIGVTPNTGFLASSGIQMDDRGFVKVDNRMRTNVPTIYAGGDIVAFPLEMKDGEPTNIQHWQMAHKHGKIAAHGIIHSYRDDTGQGETGNVDSVPFFWTVQFGISIRYAGYGGGYDSILIKGADKSGKILSEKEALDQKKFIAFYIAQNKAVAVATMMADPVAARFAQRVKNQGVLDVKEIDAFLKGEASEKKDGCLLS